MNRPWQPHEIEILRALLKRGRPYNVIAWVLPGRTPLKIGEKARALGWGPYSRSRDVVTVRGGVVRMRAVSSKRGRDEDRDIRRAARIARGT